MTGSHYTRHALTLPSSMAGTWYCPASSMKSALVFVDGGGGTAADQTTGRTLALRRHAAGGLPNSRLNARLNAASDS